MTFGKSLALLNEFELNAADGQKVAVKNNIFTRLAIKLIGVPHIGLRIRAKIVLSKIRKFKPTRILDAGTGNGLYLLELASAGYTIQGVDVESYKINRLKRYISELGYNNASVEECDLTAGSGGLEKPDFIVCSDVLEHIEEDMKAIDTMHSLLQEEGVLLITVPRISEFSSRVENNYDHVRIGYLEEDLCQTLKDKGFEIVETGQFFKAFGRVAWMLDRQLRKIPGLKSIAFWPLFYLAQLDVLLPNSKQAGGLYIVARKAN